MQIIVMHTRITKASTVTLTHWHLALAVLVFMIAVLMSASLLYYITFRHAAGLDIPLVRELVASAAQDDTSKKDKYIKENLTAMAIKLGEMQAQLMRLDALGERVQGLAGVKPQEFNFRELPGRGGAEPSSMKEERPLEMSEFRETLDAMARSVERRADYMNVVETTLMSHKIKSKLLPTIKPVVDASYNASAFGWRLDPFSGRSAFHEGIDFAAPTGTPIVAAAGGVVIASHYHYQYGNLIEVDHGNGIVTRYAHASRLHKKVGDIVRRGQHIADIGSTGRSTGAHLHFEVLVKGVPQDPHKFLAAGANQAKMAALTTK
jgi:murein DD-endopeptidase MepM/ murein hydrolase activator NlpD